MDHPEAHAPDLSVRFERELPTLHEIFVARVGEAAATAKRRPEVAHV